MLHFSSRRRTFDNFVASQEHAFSKSVEKAGSSATEAKKNLGLIKKFRAARRARDQAMTEAYELYEGDAAFDGTFLEWLFEHADEIFALIAKIMALFGL